MPQRARPFPWFSRWSRGWLSSSLGWLFALSALSACKSAEEKCLLAQNAAEQAWQAQLTMLQTEARQAREAQSSSQTKLIKEIEPRLSAAAAKDATTRYDRNSDAWMRAYQASQNAACARDPECARQKQVNAEAKDKQADLVPKLVAVQNVLASVHGAADAAKLAVEGVGPEQGNAPLEAAKQLSVQAYERCKDVKLKPSAPSEPSH